MSLALSNRVGGKTSERGLYSGIGSLLTGDVISGFKVRQNSPLGMSVRVGGESGIRDDAFIRDSLTTYSVFIDDGQPVSATVSAAHATLPRVDAVVLYVDLSVSRTHSVVDNTNGVAKIAVVAGTPNASPSPPTTGAINTAIGASNPRTILANVSVAAASTNITDANTTSTRETTAIASLLSGTVTTSSASITSSSPTTIATLTSLVTAPGKYELVGFIYASDGGAAGVSDFSMNLKVNGSIVAMLTESISSVSWTHMIPVIYTFTYSTGTVILEAFRGSGSKTLTVVGGNQLSIKRVG